MTRLPWLGSCRRREVRPAARLELIALCATVVLPCDRHPTKLLVNGRVHSPTHPDATAMAVRGDVVAWLGSDEVGRSQFPDAEVEDLDGGFVAPGFVDSHIHLSATGLTISGLDLRAGHLARALPPDGRRLRGRPPGPAGVGSRLG